jgi:Protein of unknown function (DUF2911)
MHCLRIVPCLAAAAVLAGFPFAPAQAQRASQHGTVSQKIGNTVVTIEYNRPVARGRALFGALVPYGKIWHPGADEASHITLSTDVKVNGQPLAAGTYSLWTEPNPGRWTFIFSRAWPVYHTPYPEGQDALRVEVTPRTGQHMETLAFYFPIVDGKRAELDLHWGIVIVPLVLEVP